MSDAGVHIGIIASSGGSVFQEVVQILSRACPGLYRYSVITDRACGIEAFCEEHRIPHQRINNESNAKFSKQSAQFFSSQGGVDWIQLYFLRLVTLDVYEKYPTFNTHPSLLPTFPGFNALKKTLESGVKLFGSTLHLVTETADSGAIVAQCSMPLTSDLTLEMLQKRSFLQKVYLALVLVELFEKKQLLFANDFSGVQLLSENAGTPYANPALTHVGLLAAFEALQQREGVWITS